MGARLAFFHHFFTRYYHSFLLESLVIVLREQSTVAAAIIHDNAAGEWLLGGFSDDALEALQLLGGPAVDHAQVLLGTAAHDLMHEAVVDLVLLALDHGDVGEVRAVVALVGVLRHLVPPSHEHPLPLCVALHLLPGFALVSP